MSVQHRIKFDNTRRIKTKDFIRKGILITGVMRFKTYQGHPACRIWFRGENLFAEIRTTCMYPTQRNFAVDTSTARFHHWHHRTESCISTECMSMQEAKNMVYAWFEQQGFHRTGWWNTYFPPMSELRNYKPIIEYYL
jgi:hypothetical protein